MNRRARAFLHDRRAAVGPMVAVLASSLLLAAGLALDVGLYRLGNRDLRAATEAAALAAAMNPAQADARARDYLARNGYDPGVLRQVAVGRYCADIGIPSDQRFDPGYTRCPGTGAANAVRIRTSMPGRRFLTGALGNMLAIPDLTATATATRIDEAGLEITSGAITVTNSLVSSVNDLLGALIGVKLHLGAGEVGALMGGNVDAGLFFDALARRAGHTGTYGALIQLDHGLGDIAGAAAEATADAGAAAALRTFATQAGNGYRVPLTGVFGLGVWRNMPVGEADVPAALHAGIDAYQLLAAAAQAGPGAIDLSDAVSLAVPGSTVRLVAVATGPADRPRFSFGPAGETVVGTSALRLKLDLGLGTVSLLGNTVAANSVPVLIDVAAARAETTAIDCPGTAEQRADTRVSVLANSGLVNAYIGTAPANAMTRPMPPITDTQIGQATILNLDLGVLAHVTLKAKVVAQPVFGTTKAMVFGPGGGGTIGTPPVTGRPDVAGNGSQVGATIGSLVGGLGPGLDLDVRVLGACLPLVCSATRSAVETAVLSTLVPAITTPLTRLVGSTADPVLDNVLAALGIQLGHATVWVNGARCGVPVLV